MSSQSKAEAMVREGMNAVKAGKKEEAYRLLLRATELDDQNEQAWLWLSAVVDSPEDQQTCLENVLTINPNNERALRGLNDLRSKADRPAKQPPPAAVPPQSAQSGPFTTDVDDEDDELPTNVSWELPIPTSSPTQHQAVDEPSSDDYDDWVAGLNIGGSANSYPVPDPAPMPPPTAVPFVTDDSMFGYDDDDDLPAADTEFDSLSAFRAEAFSGGPFETTFEDEYDAEEQHTFAPMPPDFAPSPAPPPAPKTAFTTPLPPPVSDDFLEDIETGDLSPADMLTDYDDAEVENLSADDFFHYLPAEIKATRLPGTIERHSPVLLIALLALFALNVGAIILVIETLNGA